MKIAGSEKRDQVLGAMLRVQMRLPIIEASRRADIPTKVGRMQYAYANLADVWRQVKPLLQEQGILLLHPIRSEDGCSYLQTIFWHAGSDQWVGGEVVLSVAEKDSRAVGARMSFLRRYCALALLAIPTSDDDEARYFADLQRAERRAEAKERTQALQPPAPPPPPPRQPAPTPRPQARPPAPPQDEAPPAGEHSASPAPKPQPTPQRSEPSDDGVSAEEIIAAAIAAKNVHKGPDGMSTHPPWAVAIYQEILATKAPTALGIRTLCSERPADAARLFAVLRARGEA